MALSHVISEIFNVEKYRNLEIPVKSQSRSLKVVETLYGNRQPIIHTHTSVSRFLGSGLAISPNPANTSNI